MNEKEIREKLAYIEKDVNLANQEMSAFGNPYHAKTLLLRAKANLDGVLTELTKEGIL
jgi:hypothetical protein